MPWRQPTATGDFDPYKILVSELMLQQTQVGRVWPKYILFVETFPDFLSLSQASLEKVLQIWSGLGYNRRAKFLWQTAKIVQHQYGGQLPDRLEELIQLPGIGPNTAGAIQAYAFNQPVIFIETNIRSVFIYHCFQGVESVSDSQLRPLIAQALELVTDTTCSPGRQVRNWYWALMDYGAHLKQTTGNSAQRSASYSRQSAFHGSRRQIRGRILKTLAVSPASMLDLRNVIADERLESILADLQKENLISRYQTGYRLGA